MKYIFSLFIALAFADCDDYSAAYSKCGGECAPSGSCTFEECRFECLANEGCCDYFEEQCAEDPNFQWSNSDGYCDPPIDACTDPCSASTLASLALFALV